MKIILNETDKIKARKILFYSLKSVYVLLLMFLTGAIVHIYNLFYYNYEYFLDISLKNYMSMYDLGLILIFILLITGITMFIMFIYVVFGDIDHVKKN